MEYGIVQFFDDHEGKKFGFIQVLDEHGNRTGEEIWFHFHDGMRFIDASNPYFISYNKGSDGRRNRPVPHSGDKVVFERKDGKRERLKACPWGYGVHPAHVKSSRNKLINT